jgi:Cu/Ag efflux protein CusF
MYRRHLLALFVPAALAGAAVARAQAGPRGSATGEVVRVDVAGRRITLRHGEIPALDMPAMTLAWRVADPQLLQGLNPGDRVRFSGARIDGAFTVTQLEKLP